MMHFFNNASLTRRQRWAEAVPPAVWQEASQQWQEAMALGQPLSAPALQTACCHPHQEAAAMMCSAGADTKVHAAMERVRRHSCTTATTGTDSCAIGEAPAMVGGSTWSAVGPLEAGLSLTTPNGPLWSANGCGVAP